MTEALRWIPAVHVCLSDPPPDVRAIGAGERLKKAALERALDSVRSEVLGSPDSWEGPEAVYRAVAERWAVDLESMLRSPLERVINATGVIVHTNLGRAPLAKSALDAVVETSAGYSPLEYDLQSGRRGSRYTHAAGLLSLLTGAEDAVVVNNNAAALLVAVDTAAAGRSVVVSRGELIEIGGGFRIHEIVAKSGARLVEVGSTNKTHVDDYDDAVREEDVGAILKVHRSNFAQTGFVTDVNLDTLCSKGGEWGVPIIFDQGTGIVESLSFAQGEPTIRYALRAGAALVCASGDKLLGGPQAGIICGRRDWVDRIRSNPLLRAMRVDKMTLAALDATLRLHLDDPETVPVRMMLEAADEDLGRRAESILQSLGEAARAQCSLGSHAGRAGGGTLPEVEFPGRALKVTPTVLSVDELEAALRLGTPPIIVRVSDDAVWIDPRTILPGEEDVVGERLDAALAKGGNHEA